MAGGNLAEVSKNNRRKQGLVGFYQRKFFFFAFILIVSYFGFNAIRSNRFAADNIKTTTTNFSSTKEYLVAVSSAGKITVDGVAVNNRINYLSDSDELRLLILDSPGQYISNVQIKLTLPEAVAFETKTELLAIHGVGNTSVSPASDTTLLYDASNVSSNATVSIVAKMPKGTIKPSFSDRILNLLISAKSSSWILVAILLPLITLFSMIVFLIYLRKRQHVDMPDKEIPNPPMAIPPAVVGVLFNQKVGSREVAATLIDLALRGDLVILDQDRGFAFGKGRFDQRLLAYEKILLSKIFKDKLSSNQEEIEERINNHLYSKKMTLVSNGIYSLATMLGYFKVNPQKSHLKYRLIGLSFFSIGLIGFVLNMFYFKDPAYLVFFWVGMMASAVVIFVTAGYLPTRTVIGQEVLSNWLAFRKYLSNPEKIQFSEDNQEIFQKYLPYAMVLNCETNWAKRFSEHNFVMPDWFLTEKNGLSLEDFCLSLFPIVSYVGRSLAALKEPGTE